MPMCDETRTITKTAQNEKNGFYSRLDTLEERISELGKLELISRIKHKEGKGKKFRGKIIRDGS